MIVVVWSLSSSTRGGVPCGRNGRREPHVVLAARVLGDRTEYGVVSPRVLAFQVGRLHLDAAAEAFVLAFGHGQFETVGAFLKGGKLPEIGPRPARNRLAKPPTASVPSG